MILVTCGMHFQPFDRLVQAADEYAATSNEKVVIQKGPSKYNCRYAESFECIAKEKMSELMVSADVVVMQGGWGALCEAIDKKKRIVAVPRIEGVEHIHDQEQVVRKLDNLGCVVGVYDIKDLPAAIKLAKIKNFAGLERGSNQIIADQIKKWFPVHKRKNIKMLVATHIKYDGIPKDAMYLPVRVNNAASEDDFGYQGDDDGENISQKNPNYCELTVVYWGWKNLQCDYIGLSHYRRYFSVNKSIFNRLLWRKKKNDEILDYETADELCSRYDLILPKRRIYFIESLFSHYAHTHDVAHLIRTREVINEICPSYLSSFDKVMKRTWCHMFNMFLMRKSLADSYCDWLFPILFKLEGKIDLRGLSPFDARLYGRISELLLDVWIDANHIPYKEIGFVQLGKENWPKKIYYFFMAKFFGKHYTRSR